MGLREENEMWVEPAQMRDDDDVESSKMTIVMSELSMVSEKALDGKQFGRRKWNKWQGMGLLCAKAVKGRC